MISPNDKQVSVLRGINQVGGRIAMPDIDSNRDAGFLISPPVPRNPLNYGVHRANSVNSTLVEVAKWILQATDCGQVPYQHRYDFVARHRMLYSPFQDDTGMG